jgi:hypothetical protein
MKKPKLQRTKGKQLEQNKAENYAVYMNTTFVKNMVIYGALLMVLMFISISLEGLFIEVVVALAGYLASNLVFLTIAGLKIPGYQMAVARYSSDKEAKKAMVDNFKSIKATKPFALSRNKHLVSVAVGLLCAVGVMVAMMAG